MSFGHSLKIQWKWYEADEHSQRYEVHESVGFHPISSQFETCQKKISLRFPKTLPLSAAKGTHVQLSYPNILV